MRTRDGEEAKDVAGRGDVGSDGEGIIGVWDTVDGGLFIPVLRTNIFVH